MTNDTISVIPFVSKAEVARRRGLSRVAVYRLIARGHIPIDEMGRIPRAEFEALEARLINSREGHRFDRSPSDDPATEATG